MISASQFEQRHKGMTTVAKKVYAAVPMAEPWAPSFIHSEMQRQGSSMRDTRIVEGCLNSLKEAGLVLEPSRRLFVRAPIKPSKTNTDQQPQKEIDMSTKPAQTTATEPRAPMAILSDLAARLKALADDLETAALEIDEHIAAKDVDAAKLKQLQTLLKSLS